MAKPLISEDGKTGLIIAGINGGESGAQKNTRELLPLLHDHDGVTVRAGGEAATFIEGTDQAKRDAPVTSVPVVPTTLVQFAPII